MPDNPNEKYLPRESSDVIDELFRRQARVEARLDQLDRGYKQTGGVPLQRIDPTAYREPFEGERAIDASDEAHTWYSNGQWRKAGLVWPWIYLEGGGQTLPGDGGFDPILFDSLYWDPNLVTLNPADVTDGSDITFDISTLTFGATDYFLPTLRMANGIDSWYWFEIWADIGDSGDGAPGVFWEMQISADSAGGSFPNYFGTHWAHIWNGTDFFEDVMRHNFKIFSTAQRGYSLIGRQNTGVDKDFNGGMMIHYLGQLGGLTDSASWEFASP
jgi:hypothetical protein